MDVEEHQSALLAHAERQTQALESINTYFMRLLAVLTLLGLVVVIAWFSLAF